MNELPDFFKTSVLKIYQSPKEEIVDSNVLIQLKLSGGDDVTGTAGGTTNTTKHTWNTVRRKIQTYNTFVKLGKTGKKRPHEIVSISCFTCSNKTETMKVDRE